MGRRDARPHSDLENIKESGSQCIGCGRSSKQVMLMRLRTYSRSLCCGACFIKYATCENVNPIGTKCHHEPVQHFNKIGPCKVSGCGCRRWIHGLEDEFDRQLAAGVGKSPQSQECQGFGQNLGKCGEIILVGADGIIFRLCKKCERRWVQETQEGAKEMKALFDFDTSKEVPN